MHFADLGLSEPLLKAIQEQGYETPTPIQQKSILPIIKGNDVLAAAQTGTGKTAGFTLPILERLTHTTPNLQKKQIRVLVLVPTRELAAQVDESIKAYGQFLPYRSTVIFGGVGINPQLAVIRKGVEIVIATPGRLLDIVQREGIDFSALETLVLDEADRMLDMGFIHDIKKLIALMLEDRQTLLFSATFSREIKTLATSLLKSPEVIEVSKENSTVEKINQVVHFVDKSRKRELLAQLIKIKKWNQVLVFTRTKHGANRLCKQLEEYSGIQAAAIHGNKSQGARTKALKEFKEGEVKVLVATDIAARGLDIDKLPHVVNYELPNVSEDYVHRIGRTGRAGMSGEAVSFVSEDEVDLLKNIEKFIHSEIKKIEIEAFRPSFSLDEKAPKKEEARKNNRAKKPQSKKRDMAAMIGSNLQAKLEKLDKKQKSQYKKKK